MKPLKIFIFILVIALVFGIALFLFNKNLDKVCFDNDCFIIEVVDTSETRQKGLMFREQLDENRGMLFIFDTPGNYPFWMKNTLIPLDIIWISESGIIVDIKGALPCESDPCPNIYHQGVAKYVLEINAGLSSKLDLKIGERAISPSIKV